MRIKGTVSGVIFKVVLKRRPSDDMLVFQRTEIAGFAYQPMKPECWQNKLKRNEK